MHNILSKGDIVPNIETLTLTTEKYIAASRLDPLGLDTYFEQLPAINKAGDIDSLYEKLTESVLKLDIEPTKTSYEALAVLRDLDFLASSYVRHGRNPIEDVQGLEGHLVELGGIVGTVPRGTVATYALANPDNGRQRSFTGDSEESLFIDAVRQTSLALESSLEDFVRQDPTTALIQLDANLDVAIQSIVSVMRALPPEYFTEEMRPYFDPLIIESKRYLGAGGAQLQFVAFDYILWGANDPDTTYHSYFNENYSYLTPSQQSAIAEIMAKYDQHTLLEHIAMKDDKTAALAAMDALKKMKKFRYPHRKLAQDNFKVRQQGQVGSGSYTTDILDVLLFKTEQAIEVSEGILNQ